MEEKRSFRERLQRSWLYIKDRTGFFAYTDADGKLQRGKTLWEWMQLLVIPLILAGGAIFFNQQVGQHEQEIATDRNHEAALQSYLDKMTELLIDKHLRQSAKESEVRSVARSRTLTTLRSLDETRKGLLLRFLYESKLLDEENTVVSLEDANLIVANLSGANLSGANLSGANLCRADLSWAFLTGVDLSETDLHGADLRGSYLSEADLTEADLSDADLRWANLSEADLRGVYLSGVDLSGADLSEADLSEVDLSGVDLSRTYMSGVDLTDANLSEADLREVYLGEADLSGADLTGTNLTGACLADAIVIERQLDSARSLEGAVMTDEDVEKCIILRNQ
jgi:uncharacterized protein YjbI with pentapeptide repeats